MFLKQAIKSKTAKVSLPKRTSGIRCLSKFKGNSLFSASNKIHQSHFQTYNNIKQSPGFSTQILAKKSNHFFSRPQTLSRTPVFSFSRPQTPVITPIQQKSYFSPKKFNKNNINSQLSNNILITKGASKTKLFSSGNFFLITSAILLAAYTTMGNSSTKAEEHNFYEFTSKDIHGNDVSMSEFKDKVVIVVNVASK